MQIARVVWRWPCWPRPLTDLIKKKAVEWSDKTLGLWGSEIRGVFSAAQTAQGRPGRRHAENCVSAGVRLGPIRPAAIQP